MNKKLDASEIVTGNYFNKYQSKNILYKYVTDKFCSTLSDLLSSFDDIKTIREVGCGEGHLLEIMNQQRAKLKASDISADCVQKAKQRAKSLKVDVSFKVSSIYDLGASDDKADLVVCCEVLEHLENPLEAIEVLAAIADPYLIISVPREPLWSVLNMARGKYWKSLGNTPGHLQRWNSRQITDLISSRFEVLEVKQPIPWTFLRCKKK